MTTAPHPAEMSVHGLSEPVLDAALRYLASGLSVVPLNPDAKQPAAGIRWKQYQTTPMTIDIARESFAASDRNVGIVTGAASGLVVVDIDGESGERSLSELGLALPATVEVSTPRGRHLYFRHPGHTIGNATGVLPGIDFRGDGGYVVAPPSVVGGQRYRWSEGGTACSVVLPDLPESVVGLVDQRSPTPSRINPLVSPIDGTPNDGQAHDWGQVLSTPVPEGTRNATICRLAGHLLGARHVSVEVNTALLIAWNEMQCKPPLPEGEVRTIVSGIARSEQRKRTRRSRTRRSRT